MIDDIFLPVLGNLILLGVMLISLTTAMFGIWLNRGMIN
jgi:hypothetical protein